MAPKKELQRMRSEVLKMVDQIMSDSEIINEKLNDIETSEDRDFLKDLDL